jgi:hypothetical protein
MWESKNLYFLKMLYFLNKKVDFDMNGMTGISCGLICQQRLKFFIKRSGERGERGEGGGDL